MKRRFVIWLCVALCLTLAVPSALAADAPVESTNTISHTDFYGNWASVPSSALSCDSAAGTYTRVECVDDAVVVETYDADFRYLSGRSMEMELPIYGGSYSGSAYNFLIFGQTNYEEDDSVEVIRVVKYDKNWNRLGQASLCGANTTVPFRAGTVSAVEYSGYLYIRTCHEMYTSDDGLNHQSNLTMNVRISDMEITDSLFDVKNNSYGYVSHSFNQFIAVDEATSKLVAVDLGDAYPRAVCLTSYCAAAGQDLFMIREKVSLGGGMYTYKYADCVDLLPIMGQIGANATGVSLGGFEISSAAYLTAGNTVAQNEEDYDVRGQRNVFVAVTAKDLSATEIVYLTDYTDEGVLTGTPYMVKINDNKFLVMWMEGRVLCYTFIDGQGNVLTETYETILTDYWSLPISECRPILAGDQVVWYMTNESQPVFFTLDVNQPENITESHAYSDGQCIVCGQADPSVQPEPTDPTDPTESTQPTDPTDPTESTQPTEPAGDRPFVDVAEGAYYEDAVLWAVEEGITQGVDDTHFAPENVCTRAQVVTFLWRSAGCPAPSSTVNPFEDVNDQVGYWYYDAVLWAVENGITNGRTDTSFAPDAHCTRAEVCMFLWRTLEKPDAWVNNPFTDVQPGQWFYDCVLWAVNAGVTNGTDPGLFSPDEICTRGQIVTFLYRALGK